MVDGKSVDWLLPSLELCYEKFPWLERHPPVAKGTITTAKSITHLEFECGYNNAHNQGQEGYMADLSKPGPVVALAFFREKAFDDDQARNDEKDRWKYQVENDESYALLTQLKHDSKAWAERGRGAYFTYGVPKDFYTAAFEELKKLLAKVLPNLVACSQDSMQKNHLKRLHFGYAGFEEHERATQTYLDGKDSRPLLVTSGPGGGKSALLANTIERYQENRAGTCIYHFVGVNNASTELENLLDGLAQQLELDLDKKIGKTFQSHPTENKLELLVKWWRANSKMKSLLIVIDGLNELSNEPYGDGGKLLPHDLQWLEKLWNGEFLREHVKLIVSTLDKCEQYWSGRCFEVLKDKKARVHSIKKVSAKQCDAMIQEILRRSQKQIPGSFDLMMKLTDEAGRANPLYISTFINEMKYFSGYQAAHSDVDLLETYVEEMLQTKNVAQLFDIIFKRLERVFVLPPLVGRYSLDLNTSVENNLMPFVSRGLIRTVHHKCKHWKCNRQEVHDCSMAQCHRHENHECRVHHIEPGSIVRLPGETSASLVVRVCSESKFEVVDYTKGHDFSADDSNIYLLRPSLAAKVLKMIWASKEGLRITEILDLLNEELTGDLRVQTKHSKVEQQHLQPLLAAMHRLVSRNNGLLNLDHENACRAVQNRYFAFSSYRVDRPFSGCIRTLLPKERRVAKENCARLHKFMAQYFKTKAGRDDNSDLQRGMPRAIREKNYHEVKSGEKPSFSVVARVRGFIARERTGQPSEVFVQIERMHMKAKNPQTGQPKVFTMDQCLSEMDDQQDVWRRIMGNDLVDKALDGFNITMMAYGQTGSGKTYTMFGREVPSLEDSEHACLDSDEHNHGLVPRALSQLFAKLDRRKKCEQGWIFFWEIQSELIPIGYDCLCLNFYCLV